jgi:hypothetical protein
MTLVDVTVIAPRTLKREGAAPYERMRRDKPRARSCEREVVDDAGGRT